MIVENPFNIKVNIVLHYLSDRGETIRIAQLIHFPQSNTEDFGYRFLQNSTSDKVEIIDILKQFDYR